MLGLNCGTKGSFDSDWVAVSGKGGMVLSISLESVGISSMAGVGPFGAGTLKPFSCCCTDAVRAVGFSSPFSRVSTWASKVEGQQSSPVTTMQISMVSAYLIAPPTASHIPALDRFSCALHRRHIHGLVANKFHSSVVSRRISASCACTPRMRFASDEGHGYYRHHRELERSRRDYPA